MVRHQLHALLTRDLPVAAVVFVVVFIMTLLLPKIVRGEEQKFVVVNKVPAFTVVNKVAAPTPPTDPSQPAPAGYRWIKYGNDPWKLEKDAPGVAVPKGATFLDRSHTCAKCGREQRVVSGFNSDGTHTHVCTSCGHAWRH